MAGIQRQLEALAAEMADSRAFIQNAYSAAVQAFEDANFIEGDPAKAGHNKAHGQFGILMQQHDKVAKFASQLAFMRSNSKKWKVAKAVAATT